jgi:predicted transcriptional regulator YheO
MVIRLRDLDHLKTEEVFEVLGAVGQMLSATLGDWCEVVVHDLSGDLEHSIVSISGNVTGRSIGGHITDLGLVKLRAGQTEPLLNYTSYTADGKTLRSSSIFMHDEEGKPFLAFCVNLNLTPVLLFEGFLRNLSSYEDKSGVTEFFSDDLGKMLDSMIAECVNRLGKPVSLMTKGDRKQVVQLLDERGIFQIRRSVPLVAQRLGVTEKTVYNYLGELERESGDTG